MMYLGRNECPETAIVVNYKELKKLGIDIPKSYEDLINQNIKDL